MRTSIRMLTVGAAAAPCSSAACRDRRRRRAQDGPDRSRVLVFSRSPRTATTGCPRGSQPYEGARASSGGFTVDATEDAGAFTARNLARYNAVVFLSTTGDVLDTTQQAAFEQVRRGARTAVWRRHPRGRRHRVRLGCNGGLAGAYSMSRPAIQPATVTVEPLQPGDLGAPEIGSAWTSGTTTARIRATGPTSSPRSTSPRTPAAHDERRRRWPGAGVPGRPRLLHRGRPVPRSPTPNPPSDSTCWVASGTPSAPPRPTAARRTATRRSSTARPSRWRRGTGGPGFVLAERRRHADVARRPGDALVALASWFGSLLAEAGLAGGRDDNSECSSGSRSPTTPGRPSTTATRSRSTRPTPPTAPPGPCTASSPPT